MSSFNQAHLRNIKSSFEEKTGVELTSRKPLRHSIRTVTVLAAVVGCCLTMTAFAISMFSSLSGDDLSLAATYEGNGVVFVQVENRSDKELDFQSALKLMRWSTSEEVKPLSITPQYLLIQVVRWKLTFQGPTICRYWKRRF